MTASPPPLPEAIERDLVEALDRGIDTLEARARELAAAHPEHSESISRWVAMARAESMGEPLAVRDREHHPERIGPYRILDVLGEGGMGTVYLAEQKKPVQRKVALKLIKLGMDSKAVVARFEQERQALAMMDHDGIAKVHDCGTTERGQPYFVMERVKGVPIDRFCEQQQLSLERRLALVQQVCAAVQHAHQKGVVHRDLKPGNVLVREDGGKLQVKVIDFGLAKAMGQKLVEATLFTEAGQIVGTPEYMAPEQADPTNQDIDTRADIYSLGVVLYQVLVGELPFPSQELRRAGMLEVQRILREVDPPKPSTRLSSAGDASSAIAKQRKLSVSALQKALRTDLDWVVLKALEKERSRRYDTANALSADLQRYLDHEPLVAGPPSAAYRLRKIARRYRGQLIASGFVVAASLGFGAVAFVQYLRAQDNAKTAQENAKTARDNEQLANDRAASESAAKTELAKTIGEFNQLKGVPKYDRVVAEELELYPPWPEKIDAMLAWQRDCDELLGMRTEIEGTVERLREGALDWTDEQQQADREAHPRYAEWQARELRLASLQRAQAIRAGELELILPELSEEQQALDPMALNELAWPRVAPQDDQRTLWGEEELGLAAAKLAAEKAQGTEGEYRILDTLAWAYLANGLDAQAKAASEQSLEAAPRQAEAEYERYLGQIQEAVARSGEILAELEQTQAALDAEVTARRTWAFAEEDDAEEFLHDTLAGLLGNLDRLDAVQKAEVEQRVGWARQLDEGFVHPDAPLGWPEVRVQIARSPKYEGLTIELRDEDVVGLVPLGANPVTGYFEFYDLRSAWDGECAIKDIPIPTHDPETGHIAVGEETGIVFVLLPGGTVTLGSQDSDPDAPNYDPQRQSDEPLCQVTLDPFFLARHEMTQGQWLRLASGGIEGSPSQYGPGLWVRGMKAAVNLAHPVERVDWTMCDTLLRRYGMELPTEAQWEYGCRGGETSLWWSGSEVGNLRGVANVLDLRAKQAVPGWFGEPVPWDDEFVIHAPVGVLRANGFGLHDVHGNLWEWCRDEYGRARQLLQSGSGVQLLVNGVGIRVSRGGSFCLVARVARATDRFSLAPAVRQDDLGVRPSRISRRND